MTTRTHRETETMTTETIPGQVATPPIAFIVEPLRPPCQPYLTLDAAVAAKREKRGDIITPYFAKQKAPK